MACTLHCMHSKTCNLKNMQRHCCRCRCQHVPSISATTSSTLKTPVPWCAVGSTTRMRAHKCVSAARKRKKERARKAATKKSTGIEAAAYTDTFHRLMPHSAGWKGPRKSQVLHQLPNAGPRVPAQPLITPTHGSHTRDLQRPSVRPLAGQ